MPEVSEFNSTHVLSTYDVLHLSLLFNSITISTRPERSLTDSL